MKIPRLKKGSKIAFINVSDVPARITKEKMNAGKKVIEDMGFLVEVVTVTLGNRSTLKDIATHSFPKKLIEI